MTRLHHIFMVLCRSVSSVLQQFVSYSPPGEGKGARLFFLVPAFWHLEVTRQGLGMVPLVHLKEVLNENYSRKSRAVLPT